MFVDVIGEFYSNVNINPTSVAIFNVYSSCDFNEKVSLWEELISIKGGRM